MKPFDVAIDTIEELEYVYQQVFRFDSGYMNEFLGMVNLLSPFASYLV